MDKIIIIQRRGNPVNMFLDFIAKKIRFWQTRKTMTRQGANPPQPPQAISKSLDDNITQIKTILGASWDIKIHRFLFGSDDNLKGALIYIDGLVDLPLMTESILKPFLMNVEPLGDAANTMDKIKHAVLCTGSVREVQTLLDLINGCLSGNTALLSDGLATALLISAKGFEKRAVSEPHTEAVVRGPREGFIEDLRTNLSLIRHRIKSPQFRVDHTTIGQQTRTEICIAYIEGIADPAIIAEVKSRLSGIDVGSILDSGYIEQYIEDAPLSIFATVNNTEKPDVAAARILEGRICIIVDGSPFVLTVPMVFIESFQTAEDYYMRPLYASMVRMLRYIAYILAIFSPAIYIALTTFHQELIPTTLLFTIASAREGTPFPAFIEALVMVFSFEVLREAGLRLPRPVGQAISIVGALIMGEASVSAGLVGAPMVITIALMAVASFIVPGQIDSASFLRVVSMLLATFLGGFGIALCFLWILIHLASLRSFGVPYFEGLTISRDLEDSFVRMPLWTMIKRPKDIAIGNVTRRRFFIPPFRPYETDRQNESDPI